MPELSDDAHVWSCYNGLLLGPDVDRVRKLLVRYELLKRCLGVPGDVVECGVFKGAGLMYWLKLLAILAPAAQRRVVGFDTFSSFSDSLLPYEQGSAGAFTSEASFDGVNPDDILALARAGGFADRVELVAGDIATSGPKYVLENPGFRIALLHLDLDTYHGTRAALEAFYTSVVPGGLIVLDEYGSRGWGESDAVDEFFAGRGVEIRSIDQSIQPTACIVKP